MPKSLRRHAIGLAVLAVLFFLFFQVSKHNLSLARGNPFADDPYDAVGSFSSQFVIMVAALSVMRAFRPYPPGSCLQRQSGLVASGQLMVLLAVAITCITDGIAMARHTKMWLGSSAGSILLAAVACLCLWVTVEGALLFRTLPSAGRTPARWCSAVLVSVLVVSVAVWYPESLRQSLVGALITVVVGAAILFVPIRAIALAASGEADGPVFDLLDDLLAVCSWVESRMPFLPRISRLVQRGASPRSSRRARPWFSQRVVWWCLVALTGFAIGSFLSWREMADEHDPIPLCKVVTVAIVYVGLETAAIAMGYLLLSRPLQLVWRSTVRGDGTCTRLGP